MVICQTNPAVRSTLSRRSAISLVLGAAGALAATAPTLAGDWPKQPVRVMTFGPAGSAPDLAARIWSEKLSAIWKQPVLIENRPGGDGIIAVQAMLGAKDEHTIFFGPHFIYSVLHNTNTQIAIRPRDEMVPICGTNLDFIGFAVSAKVPVASVSELKDYARANPGKLTWWAPSGSTLWLVMQEFIATADLKMLYVPYSSAPKAVSDLIEDRLHVAMMPMAPLIGQVEAQRAKLIATTGTRRPPSAPQTATASEQGFPNLTVDGVFGFYAPKSMPAAVIGQIANAVASAATEPGLDARFTKIGQSLRVLQTSDFVTELADYETKSAKLARTYKQ